MACSLARGAKLSTYREKRKSVLGPSTHPADLPVAEAGTGGDGSPQAQEFGFETHAHDTEMAPGRLGARGPKCFIDPGQ